MLPMHWIDPSLAIDHSSEYATSTVKGSCPLVEPPSELEALDAMINDAMDRGEFRLYNKLHSARSEIVESLPAAVPLIRTQIRFVDGACKVKVHVEESELWLPDAPSWAMRALTRYGNLPMI